MLAGHRFFRSSRWGGRLSAVSFPLLVLSGTHASAQEALRAALDADRSARARQVVAPDTIQPLRAGPVSFNVGLSFGVEYSDNVRNTRTPREDDFVLRPQLDIKASLPVSDTGRVSLGVGAGYADYLRHNDLDRPYFVPNSELAYDFSVKDFQFTLYDTFEYSYTVEEVSGLSGVSQFPRFQNTAGVRAIWVPSEWSVQAGYSHFNFISDGNQFSYLDRSSEQFFARLAFSFAPATRAGVEASAGLTDYNEHIQADNTSFSLGPFADWQVTDALALNVRGGFTHYSFDATSGSTNVPVRLPAPAYGLDSYYAGAGIDHRLTEFITHGISYIHEIRPAVNQGSEVSESDRVTYQASWRMTENSTLGMNFTYDGGTESQTQLLAVNSEKYEVLSAGLNVGYSVSRHASVTAGYSHSRRTSNDSARSYFVNRVTMGLRYRF